MTMFRTIHGSAHAIPIPDASVQCCVTSPPYWGLRKYSGDQGVAWPAVTYAPMPGLPPVTVAAMTCDLGLEPDPVAYVGHLILCLREWRRVLRDDGTVWVNLGDSYAANRGYQVPDSHVNGNRSAGISSVVSDGLKPKDLTGIPWRFAFAAQADGWWLRSDIIWAKPNPMPESVTDRPTKAHEYLFMLAKAQRYYWDADAVREITGSEMSWEEYAVKTAPGATWESGGITRYAGANKHDGGKSHPAGRNLRSVWTIATQPTGFAHFATFPEKLVEPCIRAGSSERGACPHCGAPWRRMVERSNPPKAANTGEDLSNGAAITSNPQTSNGLHRNGGGVYSQSKVLGWQPSCECPAAEPVPCVVLDPFSGSGTTGVVAVRLGRAYVGVDISQEYLDGVTAERTGEGIQVGMGF